MALGAFPLLLLIGMWMCLHISRVISTRVLLVVGDGGWWWFLGLGMGPFGEGARAQSGSVKCCP